MKNVLSILVLFVLTGLIACSKDRDLDTANALYLVKVTDYVTDSPVEGAVLTRSTTYLNLVCFCFVGSGSDHLGISNAAGLIPNVKLGTGNNLYIEKAGYLFPGILEKSQSLWHFKLFNKSALNLSLLNNNFTEAYLEVWPILKDGKTGPSKVASYSISNVSTIQTEAAGGLQNRVLILNRNYQGPPDTLAIANSFVPLNSVTAVTIPL